MKIVHVETGRHLYGGAQQVAYLLDGLQQRGVDNLLVCTPGAVIGQHFAGSTVRVRALRCWAGDIDIGFAFGLRRLLAEEKPDLVHLHSRRGADVMGAWGVQMAGLPCVLSRRVDNPEPRWWSALKYRLHDRIIAISHGIAEVLAAQGVPTGKLCVVRSSLDPRAWQQPQTRADFAVQFGVPEDAVLIGVIAQLIERKGHRVLFRALRQLPQRERVRVICFGQGALREKLEREAAELDGIVRFAGFRADLPRWLGCLDLVAHPAWMEGLGVSLLQAAAASVPVIASRAGGLPEAVRDGVTGVLVEPGDIDAWTAALSALIADPDRRRQLGAQGRDRIEQEFSVDAMVEGNLAVYRELLGGG